MALYIAIEAERQRNERFRHEAARRAAEEQRRWERQERERHEREAVGALLGEVEAFENARRIRAYVKAMRDLDAKSREWAEWALAVAGRLDPPKGKA